MRILTVNAGSSSVRLALFACEAGVLRPDVVVRYEWQGGESRELLEGFVARLRTVHRTVHTEQVDVVVHRVVHGGARLTGARCIDSEIEVEIARLAPLAPLHNPRALAWMRSCREVLGGETPQFAVFDTAFFAQLPEVASHYALPTALRERHGIRRYGFHGIAHRALWSRWRELRPDLPDGGRVIAFQLGAGCSVTAIAHGAVRDTSMGFSPLEGLVMATRSGDLDPFIATFLQRVEGIDVSQVEQLLQERSGLLGVSGISGDMRVLLECDEPAARLAVELYCYRARKYVGAYLAALGGADGILFGGGVGENAPRVRAGILEGLEWAGIRLDQDTNAAAVGREACISAPASRVDVRVIAVDEARVLAEEALAAMQA